MGARSSENTAQKNTVQWRRRHNFVGRAEVVRSGSSSGDLGPADPFPARASRATSAVARAGNDGRARVPSRAGARSRPRARSVRERRRRAPRGPPLPRRPHRAPRRPDHLPLLLHRELLPEDGALRRSGGDERAPAPRATDRPSRAPRLPRSSRVRPSRLLPPPGSWSAPSSAPPRSLPPILPSPPSTNPNSHSVVQLRRHVSYPGTPSSFDASHPELVASLPPETLAVVHAELAAELRRRRREPAESARRRRKIAAAYKRLRPDAYRLDVDKRLAALARIAREAVQADPATAREKLLERAAAISGADGGGARRSASARRRLLLPRVSRSLPRRASRGDRALRGVASGHRRPGRPPEHDERERGAAGGDPGDVRGGGGPAGAGVRRAPQRRAVW